MRINFIFGGENEKLIPGFDLIYLMTFGHRSRSPEVIENFNRVMAQNVRF